MQKTSMTELAGVLYNTGVNERILKVVASPLSEIKRDNITVGLTFMSPGKIHEEHAHENSQELITIVRGEADVRIAGVEMHLNAGDIVSIDKGDPHTLTNSGAEDLVILWIYDPPGPEKKTFDLMNKNGAI